LREFFSRSKYDGVRAERVITIVSKIGYSRSLGGGGGGTSPSDSDQSYPTLAVLGLDVYNFQIVSDADRLDAMGAFGIARCFAFGAVKGNVIFDPNRLPVVWFSNRQAYEDHKHGPAFNHFFEKLLKLADTLSTSSGRTLGKSRHDLLLAFVDGMKDEANQCYGLSVDTQ
jgi:hypothetical protein